MSNSAPRLDNDWDEFLSRQFEEPYLTCLQKCIEEERSCFNVYPPRDKVFEALRLTRCAETKVVIVGQDPYFHSGEAHGLAFSVPRGVKAPPSLRNILRKVEEEGFHVDPGHSNLEPWADKGVLLLNVRLTVREGVAGSHRGMGWETFTDRVIEEVAARANPVFMLWGREAKQKKKLLVNTRPEMIIESPHPRTPAFLARENQPFSRANAALGPGKEIDWSLPG